MLSQMPLQTYLLMLMLNYASSVSALQVLKRGSLSLNPELESLAKKLQEKIRLANQEELTKELQSQLSTKFAEVISVVKLLNEYKYNRSLQDAPVVWQDGSTRVFNFLAKDKNAPVIIFIPPLINKSYVLDLSEKRSFVRYLQQQNINSYLVDWGEPDDAELAFNLDDYIAGRLDKIITHVKNAAGKKIFLAGYCMGGLMATASALRNQEELEGLALFATPWDFHAKEFARFNLNDDALMVVEKTIAAADRIPANIIQAMFYYMHPDSVTQKFESFLDDKREVEELIALEHWVNDGISMTKAVGHECFINWVHYNNVMQGKWQVAGEVVNPKNIKVPVFFSIAERDHIVPKSCSLPLLQMFENRQVLITDTGHVSMVAGSKAKKLVWEPFAEWVKTSPLPAYKTPL
jgi:polyhydroxyalkanoate synthase